MTLRSFGLPVTNDICGAFHAEGIFDSEREAKQYLCKVAYDYFDDPYQYELACLDVEKYGCLKIETIYATIEAEGEIIELLTKLNY